MVKPSFSLPLAGLALLLVMGMARSPGPAEQISEAHGGKGAFYRLRDVQFLREVCLPPPNTSCDQSLERFLFEDEKSYIKYLSGPRANREEWFDGSKAYASPANSPSSDELEHIRIHRQASYYWFALPFKLLDAGTSISAHGLRTLRNQAYRVFQLEFESGVGHATDVYRLFIDEQNLIRWVHFTQHELNPGNWYMMEFHLDQINGLHLFVRSTLYASTSESTIRTPLQHETLSEIQFWNGFTPSDFTPHPTHYSSTEGQ